MRLPRIAGFLLIPALLSIPAFAATPKPESPADAPVKRRVTTGVIPPVLSQNRIAIPPNSLTPITLNEATVVLSLFVDAEGHAQSVRVVKSVTPELDARVVDGILHSQFQPATLDHQAVGVELDLAVKVQR